MYDKYKRFIRGVSVNWYGKLGVILTTSSFVTFVVLELTRLLGLLTNAYVGLITYLLFPALFVLGLLLVPAGWFSYKKSTGKTTGELLNERFTEEDQQRGIFGTRVFRTVLLLTILNVLFMLGASSQMLHFMDTPNFCGTACHSVMNPEWTTYQVSPHARVKCVECHVGEGVDALVNSKLNGAYQMLSITLNLYEKPIPTPVHQLRPARETCEKCHWPSKFYGTRLKTITSYEHDSLSSAKYTTLAMKIDSQRGDSRSGIHWHIDSTNEIRYASVDDERREMIWVDVKMPDGSYERYANKSFTGVKPSEHDGRVMDCVDCHNRATHIYEYPENAVNKSMLAGEIRKELPFAARQALAAISGDYPDKETGLTGVDDSFRWFYKTRYPELLAKRSEDIDRAIEALQEIYSTNIHPGMNIAWGSYPNFIGHKNNQGCFRCHNNKLVSEDGEHIPYDCTLCHSILAYDSSRPFEYLSQPDTSSTDYMMHDYLQDEFMKSYQP